MIQFTFFFLHITGTSTFNFKFCLFFFLPELHYFFTLKLNCNKILPVLSEKVKAGKEIGKLNSLETRCLCRTSGCANWFTNSSCSLQ